MKTEGNKTTTMSTPSAIGPNDTISVHGRHLYKSSDGTRFMMKGIAFPVSVIDPLEYNPKSWIAILEQLRSLDFRYNAVRVYRMDPTIDYSEFFHAAAQLGVYVIVPLTSARGDGVIDRDKKSPKCYPKKLYNFGVSALKNYLQYPNVLGGLLANEVMNSEESWGAAPCIKAYGRDLRLFMEREVARGTLPRTLPLLYAAQHSGLGADVSPEQAMRLTSDYLTCVDEDGGGQSIDVFGVNIESWCSSSNTFLRNEDGTTGSYYEMYTTFHRTSIPIVFSEMGCSLNFFNKDNEDPHAVKFVRDWKQVPVVLGDMAEEWSGFCAYAYDGNPEFNLFEGGPWRENPLKPTDDFYHLRDRLREVDEAGNFTYTEKSGDVMIPPLCEGVEKELKDKVGMNMYDYRKIRSYASGSEKHNIILTVLVLFALAVSAYFVKRWWRKKTAVYHTIDEVVF